MNERRSVKFTLQVFDDETPELFEIIDRLPASRIARRYAILRMLETGALGERIAPVRQPVSQPASMPDQQAAQTKPQPAPQAETAVAEPVGVDENIPADDLGNLFP